MSAYHSVDWSLGADPRCLQCYGKPAVVLLDVHASKPIVAAVVLSIFRAESAEVRGGGERGARTARREWLRAIES